MKLKFYPNEDGFGPYTGICYVINGLLAVDPLLEIVVQGNKAGFLSQFLAPQLRSYLEITYSFIKM